MSVVSRGFSAIGKLLLLGVLLAAFLASMAGVVYMSLSGAEVSVPDITGKDFIESEKELAALGLKIKRRADRASTEKINTVLEQLPKPGETVKTGQMILVVVSKLGAEGEAPLPTLKKQDEDDSEKIEEMISDKQKKTKSNSNTNKKKADTKRDVIANTATSSSNDAKAADEGEKKEPSVDKPSDKGDKSDSPKTQSTPNVAKPNTARPGSGDPRQRP